MLFAYLLTLAPSDHAGRAYAPYGAIYIVASRLWAGLWLAKRATAVYFGHYWRRAGHFLPPRSFCSGHARHSVQQIGAAAKEPISTLYATGSTSGDPKPDPRERLLCADPRGRSNSGNQADCQYSGFILFERRVVLFEEFLRSPQVGRAPFAFYCAQFHAAYFPGYGLG